MSVCLYVCMYVMYPYGLVYTSHMKSWRTVILPYKVVNIRFMTLYGIITGSLPAKFDKRGISRNLFRTLKCKDV